MLSEKMKADGWIEHDGIYAPKPRIEVLLRDGSTQIAPADRFIWTHFNIPSDIIAYRPETQNG